MMKSRHAIPIFAALAVPACLMTAIHAADVRAKADVACKAMERKLHYDCTIRLMNARTGEPLTGVTLTVGADMPSMPMAHNVRPVKAEARDEPGVYRAVIALEMSGDWALHLNLAGPVRDRVIVTMRFEDEGPASGASPGTHRKH